jgi:hypothetical protein
MGRQYDKPRRINIVSGIFLLAAAAGLYSAVQFGPCYYRKWRANGVLSEAANRVYPKRRVSADAAVEFTDKVRSEATAQLREIGISDPGLRLTIDRSAAHVGVTAEYVEIVKHPFVGKITTLSFAPHVDVDAKDE